MRRCHFIAEILNQNFKSKTKSQRFYNIKKEKRRYQIECTPRGSGIPFTRVTQSRKIGKPNNSKILKSNKVKGPKHIENDDYS